LPANPGISWNTAPTRIRKILVLTATVGSPTVNKGWNYGKMQLQVEGMSPPRKLPGMPGASQGQRHPGLVPASQPAEKGGRKIKRSPGRGSFAGNALSGPGCRNKKETISGKLIVSGCLTY